MNSQWKVLNAILLLIFLISCSEKSGSSAFSGFEYKGDKLYKSTETEPYTGEITHRNDEGTKMISTFENGEIYKITSFYPTGEKQAVNFKDPEFNKRLITWYKSGQKKFESKKGMIREWYEDGQLKAEVPLNDHGRMEGQVTVWFQDGSKKGVEHYADGKLHGERIKWDQSGEVIEKAVYKNGTRIKSTSNG